MCNAVKKITLCTCTANGNIVHHKHSRKQKLDARITYAWTLYQYKGTYDSGMDGMLISPSDMLNEYINNENMLHELNMRNCFDVEYTPNEEDLLTMYEHDKKQDAFLSFIFRNNQWVCDSYNTFDVKIERVNYGVVFVE